MRVHKKSGHVFNMSAFIFHEYFLCFKIYVSISYLIKQLKNKNAALVVKPQ
ncbi:hypothetical protein CHU_3250 [Cytophaga hutchinsonii ATCC 33406]|uniref:Uncharacterized protein n=1 Tax=Cytophaga hutchinsonii (strain ATCC 33406 / DSM 1761 / CIP 103989 / NBRC 15051 / NCIMB 9469 / D465) TaxID=269798 RepID=A0A6N4SVN9_CYTH3|nr:hypothetical protein CHU_3250 [Cytophaga hutchinsonii ATCC 33406]